MSQDQVDRNPIRPATHPWSGIADIAFRLSLLATALAVFGSIVGLAEPSIYVALTPMFLPQALAQDIANLAVVSPAMAILAVISLRGSLRAYLLWLGAVMFTIYNYVIYAFSIPFGLLYPVWLAVLGLSSFALVGGVAGADHRAIQACYTSRRAAVATGVMLIATALLFALLWLSEDVPAWVAGTAPQSLADYGLPTNPVHILDLAFFVPAVLLTGVAILRRVPFGHSLAPSFVVFLLLTGVPILITPVVQIARGESADWGAFGPIAVLTVLQVGLLIWLVPTVKAPS